MARSPKGLSQSPHALDFEDPRGDVLADVITTSLLRNALYRRLECRAPWGIRMPSRGRAVFYLVARGSARLEVDGEPLALLSAGDVAFVPHGTSHVVRDAASSQPQLVCDGIHCKPPPDSSPRVLGGSGSPTSLVLGFFEFRGGPKPSLLSTLPTLVQLSASDPKAQPWLGSIVQLLLAESAAPGPASALVQQRLADVLFVHALRALMVPSRCPRSGLPALAEPRIGDALALLHAHTEHPWTVATLAARVGLSRSSFAARFNQLVGEPPLQYLARWRMARAAALLEDRRLGIDEIAGRVGYESVPSFTKAFKRWQGNSPGAYRRTQLPATPERTR